MFCLLWQYLRYLEQAVNSFLPGQTSPSSFNCQAFQILPFLTLQHFLCVSKTVSPRNKADIPCVVWAWSMVCVSLLAFYPPGGKESLPMGRALLPYLSASLVLNTLPAPTCFVLWTVRWGWGGEASCPTDLGASFCSECQNVPFSSSWNTFLPGSCLVLSLTFVSL